MQFTHPFWPLHHDEFCLDRHSTASVDAVTPRALRAKAEAPVNWAPKGRMCWPQSQGQHLAWRPPRRAARRIRARLLFLADGTGAMCAMIPLGGRRPRGWPEIECWAANSLANSKAHSVLMMPDALKWDYQPTHTSDSEAGCCRSKRSVSRARTVVHNPGLKPRIAEATAARISQGAHRGPRGGPRLDAPGFRRQHILFV